ncbi:hypothetical protein FM037_03285 [Shewanella psychropiezotolerans]|uniref:Uncharacterized protein n=1 Tax=Shewanella psychropiezotolerans TaxID=2593655 RepID=A0ABX5WTM3_9GAMM|nr:MULTISPECIES: hypothetical protein [Shewanella]MPY24499.1 hypothetical protein [Shewanella sp. YLB-07]QDO82445.1 hypothetical protein FM037_03285 [Shewanella psychropiezotolerans]
MTSMTKEEREALRIKADQEIVRLGAMMPQCYTPENRDSMYTLIVIFLLWVFLMACLVYPGFVYAADPFAPAKSEIVDTVGTGSTAQFALLVIGLCAAGITGFLTKNWGAAIGGFVVGMIFLNVSLRVVGL